MTLEDEHRPLDIAIWNAIIATLPLDCCAARLDVSASRDRDDSLEMPHCISILDDTPGVCIASDEFFRLTNEHLAVFQRHGKPWTALAFTVRYDFDSEQWRCSTDYEY